MPKEWLEKRGIGVKEFFASPPANSLLFYIIIRMPMPPSILPILTIICWS
ncbi:hypothetical protein ABNF65_15260 [Paenibacillus larvae]